MSSLGPPSESVLWWADVSTSPPGAAAVGKRADLVYGVYRRTEGDVWTGGAEGGRSWPEFEQSRVRPHPAQFGAEIFDAIRANRGNVIGQTDFPRRSRLLPRSDPNYRGEVYVRGDTAPLAARVTPNAVDVTVQVRTLGLLPVNQAYFRSWRATGTLPGDLIRSTEGLLSTHIPPGDHEISLRY